MPQIIDRQRFANVGVGMTVDDFEVGHKASSVWVLFDVARFLAIQCSSCLLAQVSIPNMLPPTSVPPGVGHGRIRFDINGQLRCIERTSL